jgi:hypothetical protein
MYGFAHICRSRAHVSMYEIVLIGIKIYLCRYLGDKKLG